MIVIQNKRKKPENILKAYPGAIICDVTSKAKDSLVKLSPFYPHGGIPVPFSEGWTATCVEAIWQGLKVFASADVDTEMFKNDTMKNIKRTVRRFGKPLGHRKGVNGTELLGYIDARKQIYIPTFRWILENKVADIISRMKEAANTKTFDFRKDVLQKLMNCKSRYTLEKHISKLLKNKLIALNIYFFTFKTL